MKIRFATPIALIGFLIGYLIIANRVFYPLHQLIGFLLYLGVIGIIIWTIVFKWKQLSHSKKTNWKKILAVLPYVIIANILLTLAYATFVLIPIQDTALMSMSDEALEQEIVQDIHHIQNISMEMDSLYQVLNRGSFFDHSVPDRDQKSLLESVWTEFVTRSTDLDVIKNKYRGFYQLDYNVKPHLHADAFFTALLAFTTQYQKILQVIKLEQEAGWVDAFLNEGGDGYEKDSFFKMKQWATNPDVMLQLSVGSAYYLMVKQDFTQPDSIQMQLEADIQNTLLLLGKQPALFVKNPLNYYEKNISNSWQPIQKKSIRQINELSRKNLEPISGRLEAVLNQRLQPGDIILTRKNWKPIHMDLPGFWRDALLVTGKDDTHHFQFIHSDDAGVSSIMLNEIEAPDYLVVLRPELPDSIKQKAISWAIEQTGKPYDNLLDFATDDALMSSELIVKAYSSTGNRLWKPQFIQDRMIFTPNDFIRELDESWQEPNRVQPVLFWQDNQEIQDDWSSLLATWKKPKWTLLQ